MFRGEERRVVSASGKKRDISRSNVLEESRKQREQRVIDKKRMLSAIEIQKNVRRYLSQKQIRDETMRCLNHQLLQISEKALILPETVILLMKYAVTSKILTREPGKWEYVIELVTNSFQTPYFLKTLELMLIGKKIVHPFQVTLASFCRDFFPSIIGGSNSFQMKITEFFRSLSGISAVEVSPHQTPLEVFRMCVKGLIHMLRDQPYRTLRDIATHQLLSSELEKLSAALWSLCEASLLPSFERADNELLGFSGDDSTNLVRSPFLLSCHSFVGFLALLHKISPFNPTSIR
jgi:hypothetical protein